MIKWPGIIISSAVQLIVVASVSVGFILVGVVILSILLAVMRRNWRIRGEK